MLEPCTWKWFIVFVKKDKVLLFFFFYLATDIVNKYEVNTSYLQEGTESLVLALRLPNPAKYTPWKWQQKLSADRNWEREEEEDILCETDGIGHDFDSM